VNSNTNINANIDSDNDGLTDVQEIVYGIIDEITNFGAFINLGVMKGMIHISQTMDDYVSFSKTNTLVGKSGKRSLKKGDTCMARVVAISHKGDEPKIGLTMRQPGLGKIEWVKEDKLLEQREAKKVAKEEADGASNSGKSKPKGKKKEKKK
jgi:DNA-directed RNA polymerase subunit E'